MKKYSTALLFACLVSAHADSLTFRNGTTVQGSWVGIDSREISFRVDGEIRKYPRSDVSKVTFSPEPPAAGQQKVEAGMTKDQVAAILGKPDRLIAEAGAKQIYAYKDWKVTFVDDKVTDIQ
jgi:hypothetical protein